MKQYQKKWIALSAALLTVCSGMSGFSTLPASADALRGDVSGDGSIGADDAQLTLNAYVRTLSGQPNDLTEAAAAAADVNADNTLSVEDAQFILLYYVSNTVAQVPTEWETLFNAAKPKNIMPDTGDKLTILCWTGDEVEKLITEFEAAHPEYQGKCQYMQVGDSCHAARDQYIDYFNGGEDVDLFLMESDWIRRFTDHAEYTSPLSDLGFTDADFDGCYPYTLTVGRDSSGTLKAVTPFAWSGGYVYRSDLAKKYFGVNTPEEMQPLVKDWDTFTKTAEKLREATNGYTAMTASIGGLKQVWTYSKKGTWLDANGKFQMPSDAKEFADRLKLYQNNGYVTDFYQWEDAWYDIGQSDRTMGYFLSSWCMMYSYNGLPNTQLYYMEGEEKGETYGKYSVTEGPAAWFWGGSWIMLSPKCDNGTLAHDFIEQSVINTNAMTAYAEKYDEFVNNSAAMLNVKRENPLLGGASEIPALDRNAKNVDLSNWTPYDWYLCDRFGSDAYDYALGEVEYDEIPKDVKYFATHYYPELAD